MAATVVVQYQYIVTPPTSRCDEFESNIGRRQRSGRFAPKLSIEVDGTAEDEVALGKIVER
jgi:hypothetical protein